MASYSEGTSACSNRNESGARGLLAGLGVAGILVAAGPAAAQSAPYLEYSDLYGAGGTITITRVPIKEPSGTVIYKDVTIAVTANASGTVTARVTKQANSVVLITSNVQAGVYAQSNSNGNQFRISGPGAFGGGGEAEWTIAEVAGAACGAPAEFYTGPLDQSPLYSRLQAAGITDTSYSFGIINSGAACSNWPANSLIGVAPIGSQVQVALFTNYSTGKDQPTPYARYLYNCVSP